MTVGTVGDITTTTHIVAIECVNCGVVYGLSAEFQAARRRDHKTWYCPNGHSQYYSVENAEERLKRERDAAWEAQSETRQQLASERKQHAATKGKVTKLRKRAQHGVCALCTRTFANYARHMATEHPEAAK